MEQVFFSLRGPPFFFFLICVQGGGSPFLQRPSAGDFLLGGPSGALARAPLTSLLDRVLFFPRISDHGRVFLSFFLSSKTGLTWGFSFGSEKRFPFCLTPFLFLPLQISAKVVFPPS